jgi:hypothetical protein
MTPHPKRPSFELVENPAISSIPVSVSRSDDKIAFTFRGTAISKTEFASDQIISTWIDRAANMILFQKAEANAPGCRLYKTTGESLRLRFSGDNPVAQTVKGHGPLKIEEAGEGFLVVSGFETLDTRPPIPKTRTAAGAKPGPKPAVARPAPVIVPARPAPASAAPVTGPAAPVAAK